LYSYTGSGLGLTGPGLGRSLFLEVVVFVVLGVVERGVVGTVILVVPCVVAAGQGLKV
jgi:hypothetical protein